VDTLSEEQTQSQSDVRPDGRSVPAWLRGPFARALLVIVAVTGCAAPLIGLNIHRNPGLSPYDEIPYLDYLYRVDHGQFVVGKGEHVTTYTMRVVACRGVQGLFPPNPAVCRGRKPITGARWLNSADIDPPTYYVLTAAGANVIRALGVTSQLLTAGRLMGIVWAGLGLGLLLLFARRLRASWAAAIVVTFLVLCMPLYLRNWTFVTPHAMELIVTLSVLWVTVNWAEGGGRWWHLALVGLVPPAVKATDVLATGLAIVLLLFSAYRAWGAGVHRRRASLGEPSRQLIGAGILFVSTLTVSLVWLGVRSHYALMSGNEFPRFNVSHFSLSFLTNTLAVFVQPQAVLAGNQTSIAVLLQLALFGSALMALRATGRAQTFRPLAGTVLVGGIFGPWLFVVFNYVALRQFVTPLPIRYGLSVFSAAAALLAANLRRAVGIVIVAALGLILLSIDLFPSHWP